MVGNDCVYLIILFLFWILQDSKDNLALGIFVLLKTGKLHSLHRLLRPFVHLPLFKILYFLEHLPII